MGQQQEDVFCWYCQQIPHMISLASNRDEPDIAKVLTVVLHRHRQKKHPGTQLESIGPGRQL